MHNLLLSPIHIDDLVSRIACEVHGRIIDSINKPKIEPQKKYITVKEVKELTHSSITWVTRKANEGIFTRHYVGGKVLFDLEQIDSAILSGAATKYKKK